MIFVHGCEYYDGDVTELDVPTHDRPLILKNKMTDWDCDQFHPDHIRETHGDHEVIISVPKATGWDKSKATWNDYLNSFGENPRSYLAQRPMKEVLPGYEQYMGPRPCNTNKPKEKVTMMAGGDTYAPLHNHDSACSFSYQVRGRKRFLLVPPKAKVPRLSYKKLLNDPKALAHFSTIDLEHFYFDSDLKESGLMDLHTPEIVDIILEPGEVLYIPPFWWHAVFGESAFNILLVEFFDNDLFSRMPPSSMLAQYLFRNRNLFVPRLKRSIKNLLR